MMNELKNDRYITVRGSGHVSAKPDLTIINITLVKQMSEYEQTMEQAVNEIELLRKALISIGYERQALKTTDFKISTAYESRKEADGTSRQYFIGYRCTHSLRLEFDFNMKRLGETLKAISTSKASPVFEIAFSVKDKAAVSAELLVCAINNAKEKAGILAEAADIRLGSIQRIDYSWGELRVMSRTRYDTLLSLNACSSMEIEPEDIDVSDSVTVVWNIE
jgi:uncharacterized protein YggE